MFTGTKEMIDSTIYTNGRGEVTAQNVNLAMHGIIGATEKGFNAVSDEFKGVDGKIITLKNDIAELSEKGLGCITLKFPYMLLMLLEIESPEEAIIDAALIESIASEFPTLVTPLQELLEHNNKMVERIKEAASEGETPVVAIDFMALYPEILAAVGEALPGGALIGASVFPDFIYYIDYLTQNYVMLNCTVIDGIEIMLAFIGGAFGIVEYREPLTYYIPKPEEGPYTNSVYMFNTYDADDSPALYLKSNFIYTKTAITEQGLVPLSFKKSSLGKNLLVTFIVNNEVLKASA